MAKRVYVFRASARASFRLAPKTGRRIYKGLYVVNKKTLYGVNMSQHIVCFVTIDDKEKAVGLARALVERKLAACVNIIPEIRSIYFWDGRVCDETERLLIIKTRAELYGDLERAVRELHPYQTPEIIALEISRGLPEYLEWINESVLEPALG
jgi:periplasmic divalent cation tolerance protein